MAAPGYDRRHTNQFGQPIGFPVQSWSPRRPPPQTPLAGRYCRLEPLDPEIHAADLYAANSEDRDGRMWTYLPWGPFDDFNEYLIALRTGLQRPGFTTYAILVDGSAQGVAAISTALPAPAVSKSALSPIPRRCSVPRPAPRRCS
jgi:hypothetical protein